MKSTATVLLAGSVLLAACDRAETPVDNEATVTSEGAMPQPPPQTAPAPDSATVMLAGTEGRQVRGQLELTDTGDGVAIIGEVSGLTAGSVHGFHVHEHGDCSAPDASSAGGHFNPANAPHGGPDAAQKHLGDVPNITANEDGRAEINTRIAGASLREGSATNLVGKAFVVHAQPDDYKTQPAGDSGDRIACGVVR